jgi:hypothetical protein
MSSNFNCNFCNTGFTTQYSLIKHQKTARYCIKLQKNQNTVGNTLPVESIQLNNNENIIINCEFCNKEFTIKSNLKTHYSTCVLKREYDIKKEISDKFLKEIEELKLNNREEIIRLNLTIEQLEKDNNRYKIEIEDYKNRLFNREEKLTEEIIKRPSTVYQDNRQTTSNNTNYNLQFNKLFNELTPLTDEYLKESIKKIKIDDMIYTNNNAIDYNFACNLVNILKDTVFFTDPSRGKLVYKDEYGNSSRKQAQAYILECIKRSKPECIDLCKRCLDIVRIRQKEFTDEDYGKCMIGISHLSDCINKGKQHSIITEISNNLIKMSNSVSKLTPQISSSGSNGSE